ncbi:MAG: rRNA pseudouridine synthase [Bacilli bacterium]|jgi:23S rRNA pseudouridine2605 synthase|nr:rRNA pseudouridine synthase [Bacilli bacterium]
MIRLQKVIAQSGLCSRRKAEILISEGQVKVNNEVITTLGYKVSNNDEIRVNNKILRRDRLEYYVLYKPKSIISSTSDDKGRDTVIDLIDSKVRLYPIGRLDYDTTGIIILTNDGEFANLMMHPRSKIEKTYLVYVDGLIGAEQIKKLEQGVLIEGRMTSKAKARIIEKDMKHDNTKLRITITEGRNHQVKKMINAIGLNVKKLHREVYGNVNLKGLIPGMYRELKKDEIEQLKLLALR